MYACRLNYEGRYTLFVYRLSFLRIPKFILLVLMQVPDANALSANSSFDNYLTNQTIQETWDMAQEDVISYLYAYSLLLCIVYIHWES